MNGINKVLLLGVLLSIGGVLIGNAQSNHQLLFEDGKEWVVAHGIVDSTPEGDATLSTHQLLTITVDGEDVIEDILCKRLKIEVENRAAADFDGTISSRCGFCHFLNGPQTELYVYEDGDKIYVYRNPGPYYVYPEPGAENMNTELKYGDPYFDLYADFSNGEDENVPGLGTVTMVEYPLYNNVPRRTLWANWNDPIGLYNGQNCWIEGIGASTLANCFHRYSDPNEVFPTILGASYLVSCKHNGETLYDVSDKMKQRGIYIGSSEAGVELAAEDVDEGEYYSLQGIRVGHPAKGEIYIKSGKKIKY